MHRRTVGNAGRFIAISVITSLVAIGIVATPGEAASKRIGHDGEAYGTSAEVSSVFTSSPTALAGLGCTNAAGQIHTASAASGGFLAAGSMGAINDQVSTTSKSTSGESQIGSMSLFSALITAQSFTTTATTTQTDSGFTTEGNLSAGDLSINGSPINGPIPANTVVPLPGIGSVTLNEQIATVSKTQATLVVNAFHINVTTTNAFNFPVGADIVIGHVKAGLNTNVTRLLAGQAYGSSVSSIAGNSARSALIFMPCHGTNGKIRTHSLASGTIPGAVSTGTVKSTVTGSASKQFGQGTTTNTIQNVLLAGTVSVDSVKAVANAQVVGHDLTFSDTGSSFGNISVIGVPTLPDPVPPNSSYDLTIGKLYLHRVIQTKHKISVIMIELVLSVPLGPLAAGADIRIGVAQSAVSG